MEGARHRLLPRHRHGHCCAIPEKIKYVPTTAAARFTILQSGEIDVLIRDSTLTFNRSVQLGLDEIAVTSMRARASWSARSSASRRSPS